MLVDPVDADVAGPEELLARYETELADAARKAGLEAAADAADVAADRLESVDGTEVSLEEAAAVLGLAEDRDPEALLAEVRDDVMLAMSTAVLDVDAVARGLEAELSAREIQAKIEGRLEMSLREYARVRHYIASQQ